MGIRTKLAMLKQFTSGRVKDQQGLRDINLQKGSTKRSKFGQLICHYHAMHGAETRKSQCFVGATKRFDCRDVILDVFMVWATRSKESNGCWCMGFDAVGNWLSCREP
jgi:hypothetical protein